MFDSALTLLPLRALSFSRYTRLKRCLLSGAARGADKGATPLRRPMTRANAVGEMFHEVMRLFNESSPHTAVADLRQQFNSVLESTRSQLGASPLTRHLGDPRLWPEVAVIYRALVDLADRRSKSCVDPKSQVFAEKELFSRDGALFGKVDAYFIRDDAIDVVDYKSGTMVDGEQVKQDYADQLYLYAYLVRETHNIYPRTLSLVGKDGAVLSLPPSARRSEDVAADMRGILVRYNRAIADAPPAQLATPSVDSCVFCDMKTGCARFWAALDTLELPSWSHVAIGLQSKPFVKSRLGTGSVELTVETSSIRTPVLNITRLFENRFPGIDFSNHVGQRLMVTNLRQPTITNPRLVEATERTTVVSLRKAQ
jgi:RecB family exonuclease